MSTLSYRNRIVSTGVKPAAAFLAHPLNFRVHPKEQQQALEGVLAEIGWCQGVVENLTTGHVLDGHQRVLSALKSGDDTPVPYTQVDLTPEEERTVLAIFDAVGAMALTDREQLSALLAVVSSADPGLQALLTDLQKPLPTKTVEFTIPTTDPATCPTCGQKLKGPQ